MKKKIPIFQVTTLSIIISNFAFAGETTVLKYRSDQVEHEVYVTNGKVVGGKSRGGFSWLITGGAYDGKHLHVTFTSPERTGCKSWYTQIYSVNNKGPVMLVNVDKCGAVKTNLHRQQYWY